MRRITVVIVISNLEFGGAQGQIIDLVNESKNPNVEYQIVSLSDYVPLSRRLNQKEKLHIIKKRARFDFTVVFRLVRLLKRLNADIVHGYLFDAEIASRLAGKIGGIRIVIGSERNTDYKLKPVQKIAYFMTKRMQNLCIANSRAGASFNARALGYAPGHYRVVHNGVDINKFRPDCQEQSRNRLGLELNAFWVGMFASFKARKNYPMLLHAVAQLLDECSDIRLLFVGDELAGGQHGSRGEKAKILQLIDGLGLAGYITLLGNRNDMDKIYPACDVTVLPSYIEGSPNVALEAMACGVPVIATDVSDNSYVVPNNQVGLIVPLNDSVALANAIFRLKNEEELRKQMGHNARNWVIQEFTSEKLAVKMNEVYIGAVRQQAEGL